jgi:hypothetical protein
MKSFSVLISSALLITLLPGTFNHCAAQVERRQAASDSTLILRPGSMDSTSLSNNIQEIHVDSATANRPKTATFLAAAFPGLGQMYNGDYWKLPILYGAGVVMGYYISWNNNKYHQYLTALFDKENGISNLLAEHASSDQLKNGVDYYRHNRDLLMVVVAGLYMLQIVDAQVQAQLMNFNISPDLSLQFKPVINSVGFASRNIGLGIVITLN